MDKIRIGVVGCASIADRSMIPAIQSLPEMFQLVAVSSRTEDKAYTFAEKFNCEAVVGYDKLIQREDIDALYIPLPTGLHREYIEKALYAGKHVYAEKSMASTNEEASSFVNIAKAGNLALMEGYMFQYHSQHEKVFELLDSGKIGDIRYFSASFGFPPLEPNNFRYDLSVGGGALMDCAGYVVRAANFVLRQNLRVEAASVFYKEGTSLYGSAYLKGEKGVGAGISFGFDNFYQCNYQIWGSKGKLSLLKAFTPKPQETPVLLLESQYQKEEFVLVPDNHFIKAMKEFYYIVTDKMPTSREKHYNMILVQSRSLDDIYTLSK